LPDRIKIGTVVLPMPAFHGIEEETFGRSFRRGREPRAEQCREPRAERERLGDSGRTWELTEIGTQKIPAVTFVADELDQGQ